MPPVVQLASNLLWALLALARDRRQRADLPQDQEAGPGALPEDHAADGLALPVRDHARRSPSAACACPSPRSRSATRSDRGACPVDHAHAAAAPRRVDAGPAHPRLCRAGVDARGRRPGAAGRRWRRRRPRPPRTGALRQASSGADGHAGRAGHAGEATALRQRRRAASAASRAAAAIGSSRWSGVGAGPAGRAGRTPASRMA